MRQDAKLGIALGMLVIGFAIAFCFPRLQETPDWQSESTTHTATHDFIPIRAYQPQSAEVSPVPDILVDGQLGRDAQTINAQLPPSVQPITHNLKLHPANSTSLAEILNVKTSETESPVTETLLSDVPEPTLVGNPSQPTATFPRKTYQVQAGDTLTGIAYRTLGASSKYLELYEANRDVLASPDDLRVGLLLQVPEQVVSTLSSNQSPVSLQMIEETEQDRKLFGKPDAIPFISEKNDSATTRNVVKHRIQPGDTLEAIALKYYQDSHAVEIIREANPQVDPSRLKLGMDLEIPVRR